VEAPISSSIANGATADSEARIAMDGTTHGMAELRGRRRGERLELPMERPAKRVVKSWEELEGRLAVRAAAARS
jgi:hypothetical protein